MTGLDFAVAFAFAALVGFCLGVVAARVMQMRHSRAAQAAPPTGVRITATGRPSRWPSQPLPPGRLTLADEVDAYPTARCACGYVRCICPGSVPR